MAPLMIQLPLIVSNVPELPELAHNGWELATWVVGALAACVCVWFWTENRATRSQIKGVADTVDTVREHVVNDHEPNLRDDIDEAKDNSAAARTNSEMALAHVDILIGEVREWRKENGGIREELRNDREMHREDIARLNRRLDRLEKRIT